MREVSLETRLVEIGHRLGQVERVLFITGAGISADSGLPTYRGVGGLYNDGGTEDGLSIEEALSGHCFRHHPEITWKYLSQIEANCRGVRPNPAHEAIAALEAGGLEVCVLTQNVDGLHLQAGSGNVIEIHGSFAHLLCPHCHYHSEGERLAEVPRPPHCPACGSILRPDIVLFGEALPEEALNRLMDALARDFDMVFVIGTTAVFPYIVEPVAQAIRRGIPTVEINPAQTQLSPHVSDYLPLGAAEAMSAILAVWRSEQA